VINRLSYGAAWSKYLLTGRGCLAMIFCL
jgi:hypothetical protein